MKRPKTSVTVSTAAWVMLLVVALLGVGSRPAQAATPPLPTLTGEGLGNSPVFSQLSWDCSKHTVSFDVTGVALGPYPGTFREVAYVTGVGGPVGGYFFAAFTISSPTGTVRGYKSGRLFTGSTCRLDPLLVKFAAYGDAPDFTTYHASITTPDGQQRQDSGDTFVLFSANSVGFIGMTESFGSTQI